MNIGALNGHTMTDISDIWQPLTCLSVLTISITQIINFANLLHN